MRSRAMDSARRDASGRIISTQRVRVLYHEQVEPHPSRFAVDESGSLYEAWAARAEVWADTWCQRPVPSQSTEDTK